MCYVTVKYVQFVDVCTEFNVAGGVIQGQNNAVCNENFPKCDKLYNSMDAFKCKFIFQSASFKLMSFIRINVYSTGILVLCELVK